MRASAACTSRSPPSTWSGDAAVQTVEMRGRARKRSRSPASASHSRTTASTSVGQSTKVTCLRVSVSSVKYSVSSRCSSGTSDALTCVHMMSRFGSSSFSAVASRTSCRVLARRSPVRKSSVLATQPLGEKWKGSPSSSRTSSASVRPAIRMPRGHCASAHSTSSRGRRAMPVVSSTSAPRSPEQGQQGRAGEAHAHAGEQLQRLIDDPALLGLAQPRRARSHRRHPPFLTLCGRSGDSTLIDRLISAPPAAPGRRFQGEGAYDERDRVPTRMGDGTFTQLTRSEIRADLVAGSGDRGQARQGAAADRRRDRPPARDLRLAGCASSASTSATRSSSPATAPA